MDAYHIIFYFLAAMTIISAGVVAFTQKIIYAAFALLFTLCGFAAFYIYLSADFIAVTQILVYVGGILMLILFGVLLTTKIYDVSIKGGRRSIWPISIIAGAVGFVFYQIIFNTQWKATADSTFNPITEKIGLGIMGKFLLPFEIASILLLAALIGAVLIARPEPEEEK